MILHRNDQQSENRDKQIASKAEKSALLDSTCPELHLLILTRFLPSLRKSLQCKSFPVAQMVEHGASNAKLMGSIPRESKS